MGKPHGLTRYDMLVREGCNAPQKVLPQIFGRLGHRNPVTGTAPDGTPFSAKNLLPAFGKALDHMRDEKDHDSDVAAGMTFFGQFIDHDVTLDATSEIGRRIDPATIRNVRTPGLDLDCVYGDGAEASPHLYAKKPRNHFLAFGHKDNPLDLARTSHGAALIGDFRNDENVVLSQIQGLFITMHNLLMTAFEDKEHLCHKGLAGVRSRAVLEGITPGMMVFQSARRVLRQHYQWCVLHDFLPSFVDKKVLDHVMGEFKANRYPAPFGSDSPVMPVEFSGAAFRFGHATVQSKYVIC